MVFDKIANKVKVNSRWIILLFQYLYKQRDYPFIFYQLFSGIWWSKPKITFHRLDFRSIRAYVISFFQCTKVKLTACKIVCLQLVTISCDFSQVLISLNILKEHRIRISGKWAKFVMSDVIIQIYKQSGPMIQKIQ